MREVDRRTQALRELSRSLEPMDTIVRTNELKRTRLYWRSQPIGDRKALDEDAVDMVIPPHGNVPMLLGFIVQLEKILDDTRGHIVRVVGSWDRGAVITISMRLSRLGSLLGRLGNMPEVEKVEEVGQELPDGPAVSIPSNRFEFLTRSGVKPGKRVRVTLKWAQGQERNPQLRMVLTQQGKKAFPVLV
jgi:hypothetical protein